jgi:hypothetical protein
MNSAYVFYLAQGMLLGKFLELVWFVQMLCAHESLLDIVKFSSILHSSNSVWESLFPHSLNNRLYYQDLESL